MAKARALRDAVNVGDVWRDTVLKYLLVVAACMALGWLLRRSLWTFRIDVWPVAPWFLRLRNELYYLLQGRVRGIPRRIMPVADVLVDVGGKTMLYRGVVDGLFFDRSGAIEQIILNEAQRGRPPDPEKMQEFQWKDIPGHHFMIAGKTILSINVAYMLQGPPRKKWSRQWWREGLAARLRSFLFEEP